MRWEQVNRVSNRGMLLLSCFALVLVLIGSTRRPQPDEGTSAHLFQLAIVALFPVTVAYLVTADWSRPAQSARPLAVVGVALGLAFGVLYWFEHAR